MPDFEDGYLTAKGQSFGAGSLASMLLTRVRPHNLYFALDPLHDHGIQIAGFAPNILAGRGKFHPISGGRVPPSGISISRAALRMLSAVGLPYFLTACSMV